MPPSISKTAIAQTLPRYTQSGDVHIAVYDWDHDEPADYTAEAVATARMWARRRCSLR